MRVALDPEHAAPVLRRMPPGTRKRMRAALRSLADDPSGRAGGLDVKRLAVDGSEPAYRLRVGSWRAGFLLRDGRVDVLRIFRRDEGYGWLDRLYP